MSKSFLDLPDELLELILFNIIDRPWKDNVKDFLSFISTCRYLRKFVHDSKYWKIMVLHRDPFVKAFENDFNWFEYCKKIYRLRVIPGNELEQRISRYNENYFCTIEKIILYPKKIRIYIDERGNASLGDIQHPKSSTISLVENDFQKHFGFNSIRSDGSQFSIADPSSQYLGYLDFPLGLSTNCLGKFLLFTYGISGYSTTKLFCFNPTFIDRYNLIPLF